MREFQKSKSRFGISTSKIPCVPIFSQNGQLLTFRPKFEEFAQLRAIFWFKYYWGCCRELGGGWNRLGGGWDVLGGCGWSWVELGARFSNTHSIFDYWQFSIATWKLKTTGLTVLSSVYKNVHIGFVIFAIISKNENWFWAMFNSIFNFSDDEKNWKLFFGNFQSIFNSLHNGKSNSMPFDRICILGSGF